MRKAYSEARIRRVQLGVQKNLIRRPSLAGCGGFNWLRHATDPSIARFFQNFREVFINFSRFRQLGRRAKFFRNVRELEICWTSKSQLPTTHPAHENAEKPKQHKSKKCKTFSGRLPPEDGSVWLETLPASVSGDSQHLIFRPSTFLGGTFF